MDSENSMCFGGFEFAIQRATFRYITASWSGPGWDFNLSGNCLNEKEDEQVFLFGMSLYSEAAPLPLEKASDYTGIELKLPGFYDEESGEPFFALDLGESHEVSDVQLKFVKRDGNRYLLHISGTISKSVLGQPELFRLAAWAEELPDHSYSA